MPTTPEITTWERRLERLSHVLLIIAGLGLFGAGCAYINHAQTSAHDRALLLEMGQ